MSKSSSFPRLPHSGRVAPGASRRLAGALLRRWLAARRRRLAERALDHGLLDLEIPWPVELVWEKDTFYLGKVSGKNPHQIQVRSDQDQRELILTVFHEVYHLAQIHKWGDLSPRVAENSSGDVERAEALAELYSRVTLRELEKRRPAGWWEAAKALLFGATVRDW